jgi:hypothetical protein
MAPFTDFSELKGYFLALVTKSVETSQAGSQGANPW